MYVSPCVSVCVCLCVYSSMLLLSVNEYFFIDIDAIENKLLLLLLLLKGNRRHEGHKVLIKTPSERVEKK